MKAVSLKPSDAEIDSVKAFCVLAHAALEEFFEGLTEATLKQAYLKYKKKAIISSLPTTQAELDKINLGVVQLIETLVLASNFSTFSQQTSETFKDHKSKLELATGIHKSGNLLTANDLSELTKKSDTYTKEILKDTIKFFHNHIESNNGASLKYLLRLLIPVGIDIPNDPILNSLQKLATYRGDFAHSKGLTQLISASDIVKYARDVIHLCFLIERGIDDFTSI